MFTRSPFFTPIDFKALANRQTSSRSSPYVIVRVSPGSPSQWNATLPPPPASTWRSRQLYETLSDPPANHFTQGGFHSITVSQDRNQVSRSPCSAQKASTSSSARS